MPLITIGSVTLPGWQGNAVGVSLRIYCNADFTAQSGLLVPASKISNPPSLGTFFQSFDCAAAPGRDLTIPQIQLDSTTDSPDNPLATYSAVLFDETSQLPIQQFGTFARFSLPPATPTTWATIFGQEATE